MLRTVIARFGLLAAMFAVVSQALLGSVLLGPPLLGGTALAMRAGDPILSVICGDPGADRSSPRTPGVPRHDHACLFCCSSAAGDAGGPPPASLLSAPTLGRAIALQPTFGGRGHVPFPGRTGQPRGPPIWA